MKANRIVTPSVADAGEIEALARELSVTPERASELFEQAAREGMGPDYILQCAREGARKAAKP